MPSPSLIKYRKNISIFNCLLYVDLLWESSLLIRLKRDNALHLENDKYKAKKRDM